MDAKQLLTKPGTDNAINAEQLLTKMAEARRLKPKTLKHSSRVAELCQEFARRFQTEFSGKSNFSGIDEQSLYEAAWLHDIAKEKFGDTHNQPEVVRAVIQEACQQFQVIYNPTDEILEIISCHREKFLPVKKPLESALLRLCDKLDKFNKAVAKGKDDRQTIYQEVQEKCQKTMRKIRKSEVLNPDELAFLDTLWQEKLKQML